MRDGDIEPLHVRATRRHGVRRYDLTRPRLIRSALINAGKILPWWLLEDRLIYINGRTSRARSVVIDLRNPIDRMSRAAWREYDRLWHVAVKTPTVRFSDPDPSQTHPHR